jgi:uncharacterized protein YndB with AHSA1/START domain
MSVTHSTFTLERTYDASPARVFAAFADAEQKVQWFTGPEEWTLDEFEVDFRVGGRETNSGRLADGPKHTFEARYYDIVPEQRIVYAYDMLLGDERISVSLATIEFEPAGEGTKLTLTEQGAYLDAFDDPSMRKRGTGDLLEALADYLEPARAR